MRADHGGDIDPGHCSASVSWSPLTPDMISCCESRGRDERVCLTVMHCCHHQHSPTNQDIITQQTIVKDNLKASGQILKLLI